MVAVPRATNRAHYLQRDPRCDQVATLNKAMRQRPGRRFADMNAVRCKDDDMNLHWADSAAANHYRYIQVTRTRRRPMTRSELHRPVSQWHAKDIVKWRKTRKIGRSLASRSRPATVRERQIQAKRRRVVICWEIKSSLYGKNPAYAAHFVGVCKGTKWPAYYMTLVQMKYWGTKMKYFHIAGGGTALLSHGLRKMPKSFPAYAKYIDQVWSANWMGK